MTNPDGPPPSQGVSPLIRVELESEGFEDVSEIGRGGFGVVYRCQETALARTVAVKVLRSDGTGAVGAGAPAGQGQYRRTDAQNACTQERPLRCVRAP